MQGFHRIVDFVLYYLGFTLREFKNLPYIRHKNDLEAGNNSREIDEEEQEGSGPFDIVRTKGAPPDRLRRWRKAALVMNPARRFRYTLDLKKEEGRKQMIAKIRLHTQAVRAAVRFQAAGEGVNASNTPQNCALPVDESFRAAALGFPPSATACMCLVWPDWPYIFWREAGGLWASGRDVAAVAVDD
ncbi:calcium-transporting ATPase 10, plasma membrane-type-like isoform X1 [Olea europaea subsp. europaea]|uniref:Calcium-transporting ATPase 10, plasma membrane-type-like isoform X1 n=1 Tax=Olea europaea subsp. europaea TaxID=158383 RepID=A0A8S0VHW0_OLEEU|nr:calcium-transporting ATPase 10, plasma membrane-type-like isoform X1 [Olea europaea subsp. europaea]